MPTDSVSSANQGPSGCRAIVAFYRLLPLILFVASAEVGVAEPAHTDLEDYADCTAAAQAHVLDQGTARFCADAFLRIKLSFLPGIHADRYDALPPRQRALANKAGYSAYLKWKLTSFGSIGESAASTQEGSESGW